MADKRKHVDDMSSTEQMAYWRDVASGKIDLSDYELDSLVESANGEELTIKLRKIPIV